MFCEEVKNTGGTFDLVGDMVNTITAGNRSSQNLAQKSNRPFIRSLKESFRST